MEIHVITLLCLLIASVWDLRSREVPDFLSYILVGSICMIALYHGAYTQLGAAAVLFIIGWALVYGVHGAARTQNSYPSLRLLLYHFHWNIFLFYLSCSRSVHCTVLYGLHVSLCIITKEF